MKKLLSLILVLSGMVSTASAWNYLRGTFSSWTENLPEFCTDNGPVAKYLEAGSYTFKIYSDGGTWWGNGGTITGNTTFSNLSSPGTDITITVSNPGYYVFIVTWNNNVPTLEVKYPDTMVYFYNNLGWENVFLHDGWWNGDNGASNVNNLRGVAMTAGVNNVYSAYIPRASFYRITFTSDKQVSDGSGEYGAGYSNFYSTNVVWYEPQFNASTPIYVTNTSNDPAKLNGETANYYYYGQWHAYPTYTRTVTEGKFGTLCLPFAATVTGATVYEITSKVMDGETLKGINLTSVDGTLTAGKPYIFKATGTTLTATYTGSYSDTTPSGGMVGNLSSESINVPTGYYVVKDNELRKVVGGVTVGQYKAYVTLADLSPAARGLNFMGFDDESTGIQAVETAAESSDNYYNLAGQRVAQPAKGLFVKNGKKVILK